MLRGLHAVSEAHPVQMRTTSRNSGKLSSTSCVSSIAGCQAGRLGPAYWLQLDLQLEPRDTMGRRAPPGAGCR